MLRCVVSSCDVCDVCNASCGVVSFRIVVLCGCVAVLLRSCVELGCVVLCRVVLL